MSQPAIFVIGDTLAFKLDNVKSGVDGSNLPSATATYALLDHETRTVVDSGAMNQYATDPSSFDAAIDPSKLQPYDADTNPNGIKPEHDYQLKATINNSGILTSKARRLTAKLDPPDEEP